MPTVPIVPRPTFRVKLCQVMTIMTLKLDTTTKSFRKKPKLLINFVDGIPNAKIGENKENEVSLRKINPPRNFQLKPA